jgi:hypothetical protein
MPSIVDRARFKVYLWRLDYHLNDLPHSRIREIRSEIRANTASAAADVGMRRALANLGHPRVLAAGYLSAEGRPLPTYRRGIYWAIAAFWAYNWTVMSYTLGFADGGAAVDETRQIATSFLGTSIEANGAPRYAFEWALTGVSMIPTLIAFLLGSRIWRALASVRSWLAMRSS